jgi:hypothetical protein
MENPSKEDLIKKWSSILGPMGITGSQLDNLSQLAENQSNHIAESSEFPSLLPTAMKVAAKTIAMDLCFASEEEINEVKSRVQSENRDGKIDTVIEGSEFTEKKLEDDPEYKDLMKKGVTSFPMPTGQLFYLDYKYGHKKTRRSGKKHKKKSND